MNTAFLGKGLSDGVRHGFVRARLLMEVFGELVISYEAQETGCLRGMMLRG